LIELQNPNFDTIKAINLLKFLKNPTLEIQEIPMLSTKVNTFFENEEQRVEINKFTDDSENSLILTGNEKFSVSIVDNNLYVN